jgi:hypothetical protein
MNNNDLKMYSRDIAAITCWALGIEGNEKWQAEIPENMFADNKTPDRKRVDYTELQKMNLTPKAGTTSHLYNYIDSDKLQAGLFFDQSVEDIVGVHTATATDNITYEKGFYGSAVRTSSDGDFVYYSDITDINKSFAIAMWFNPDEDNEEDVCLVSNKDWDNGYNEGINIGWYENSRYFNSPKRMVWYNHADEEDRYDYKEFLPEIDSYGKWMHLTLIVDGESQTVSCYLNFNLVGAFSTEGTAFTVDPDNTFNIGSDALGYYGFNGLIDDFLLFNEALTHEEVISLKNYYAQ